MSYFLLCVLFVVIKVKFTTGSQKGLIARDREQLNRGLQMTRNQAERIGQWRSRTGRFPWLFPSLNLDRSHNELATVWWPVERLYASSRDRFCLWPMESDQKEELRSKNEARGTRDMEGCEPDWHLVTRVEARMEQRGRLRHRWANREVEWAGAHESKPGGEFQLRTQSGRSVEHCAAAL